MFRQHDVLTDFLLSNVARAQLPSKLCALSLHAVTAAAAIVVADSADARPNRKSDGSTKPAETPSTAEVTSTTQPDDKNPNAIQEGTSSKDGPSDSAAKASGAPTAAPATKKKMGLPVII